MGNYTDELTNKKYVPNAVVKIMGNYFSIRQPDSGLVIPAANIGLLSALGINPTNIDPFRPASTISQNAIKLLDKNAVITALFGSNPQIFQGEKVEVWLGRSGVGLDFSDYMKLTDTYITKVSKQDRAYTFTTREAKDRLSTGAFSESSKLAVDIVAITTVITLQNIPSGFPTSGFVKINSEFISFSGVSGNNLTGCIRGEEGSTPDAHDLGDDVYIAQIITGNPIEILLQLLISSGGGGIYDVLQDGAGIDQSLIDIDQMEQAQSDYFEDWVFTLRLFQVDSLRKFIEEEILLPCAIRLRSNNNSKIGLAILSRPSIDVDSPDLDHDQMTKVPVYDVDDTKIVNRVNINWNYDDNIGKFLSVSTYDDPDSLTQFGEKPVVTLNFKGIKSGSDTVVDEIAALYLKRFAYPKPTVTMNTHMSASRWLLGEHPRVVSSTLPTDQGDFDFDGTLEMLEKAINFETGDVKFKLSYTHFTGIQTCFLAPSDTIVTVNSQSSVDVGAGRGDFYRAGWVMRLYDNTARAIDPAGELNTILSVTGDTIVFENPWVTTLFATQFRLQFADYDDVSENQKKYCFISCGTFDDGRNPYQIVC